MFIYADLFAIANLAVDGLLLLATARLTGMRARPARLLLAAAAGAAYATAWVAGLLPPALASRGAVLAVPAVLVALAFAPAAPGELLRAVLCFYGLSATTAGLAWLLGGARGGVAVVAGVALLLAALGSRLWQGLHRARAAAGRVVTLRLRAAGRQLALPALVDSGHDLRDPIGGEWVVIADPGLAAEIAAADDGVRRPRTRLVPCRGVDGTSRLLVGLRCDEAWLEIDGTATRLPGVVVALAPGRLDPAGRFRALMPLGLFLEARCAPDSLATSGG